MTPPMMRAKAPARASRRRRPAVAAALASASLLLAGCSLLPGGPPAPTTDDPTTQATPREGTLLPEGTDEVDLAVGDTVQVSLPEGSTGVGDLWGVTEVGDPDVAAADIAIGASVFGAEPGTPSDETGGYQAFAVEITGLEPGESTVRALYCTRTNDFTEDCDQSQGTLDDPVDPVEITVRVG